MFLTKDLTVKKNARKLKVVPISQHVRLTLYLTNLKYYVFWNVLISTLMVVIPKNLEKKS